MNDDSDNSPPPPPPTPDPPPQKSIWALLDDSKKKAADKKKKIEEKRRAAVRQEMIGDYSVDPYRSDVKDENSSGSCYSLSRGLGNRADKGGSRNQVGTNKTGSPTRPQSLKRW